jgi:hypothetical protein
MLSAKRKISCLNVEPRTPPPFGDACPASYELVRAETGGDFTTSIPNSIELSSVRDTTIGTNAVNTVTIPWETRNCTQFVSREHAAITPSENGDGHFIVDLASLNGTFVNDNVVLPGQARFLQHGDVVWLGARRSWVGGKKLENECAFVYQVRLNIPSRLADAAKSDVTCMVCLEVYADNSGRSLVPCGHTLCETCARKIGAYTKPTRCPSCRAAVVLPGTVPFRCPSATRLLAASKVCRVSTRPESKNAYVVDNEKTLRATASIECAPLEHAQPTVSRERLESLIARAKDHAQTRMAKRCCSIRLIPDDDE